MSKDPEIVKKFVKHIAPTIYGHTMIKKAILLQVFGGTKKRLPDGTFRRGNIHILLVGDPGTGKSQISQSTLRIVPRSRYISGRGSSGVGTTASIVKDDLTGTNALEAGALVLANGSLLIIDEIEKMKPEDISNLHEGLSLGQISINKAGIHATLKAETSVLGIANPEFGRFDAYNSIPSQISLSPTILSRFDLIFPIKDVLDKEKTEKLTEFIINIHTSEICATEEGMDVSLFRKYISIGRKIVPKQWETEAKTKLKDFFVSLRGKDTAKQAEKPEPVAITPRQLEGLIRLSEASAKLHLRENVTINDVNFAISLIMFYLKEVGLDPETGKIDIDRIDSFPASERGRFQSVKEIIWALAGNNNQDINHMVLASECEKKGIDEFQLDKAITALKRAGDVFEPRAGTYKKI